jgi:prepilin-type N-terminal cleavage/methylation domain-containing protein
MGASDRNGFTLIELSIVLVIIGLLVGGILVGHDLIRVAELRATIRQYDSFNAAVNTFRLKYNCLPGDCASAFGLGGVGGGNGSGEDQIGVPYSLWGGGNPPDANYDEQQNFWLHLRNAGLLSTEMIDVPTSAAWTGEISLPKVKLGVASGWLLFFCAGNWCPLAPVNFAEKHVFWITGQAGHVDKEGVAKLRPMDAYAIDQKVDDGLPTSGIVQPTWDLVGDPWGPLDPLASENDAMSPDNCVVAGSPPTYGLQATSNSPDALCGLVIKAGF